MPRSSLFLAFVLSCVLVPAPAGAQNLLLNAELDANVASWSNALSGNNCVFVHAPQDSDACTGSGSVEITAAILVDQGNQFADLSQCRPTTPGTKHVARARLLTSVGTGLEGSVGLQYFSDGSCQSFISEGFVFTTPTPLSSVEWTEITTAEATAPAGAASVIHFVQGRKLGSVAPQVKIRMDRAYLGSAQHVFEEDHEIGSACRW